MRLDRAIDLYLGDLARQGKSKKTLFTYETGSSVVRPARRLSSLPTLRRDGERLPAHLDIWRDRRRVRVITRGRY